MAANIQTRHQEHTCFKNHWVITSRYVLGITEAPRCSLLTGSFDGPGVKRILGPESMGLGPLVLRLSYLGQDPVFI
jgi:hypothetical protein